MEVENYEAAMFEAGYFTVKSHLLGKGYQGGGWMAKCSFTQCQKFLSF